MVRFKRSRQSLENEHLIDTWNGNLVYNEQSDATQEIVPKLVELIDNIKEQTTMDALINGTVDIVLLHRAGTIGWMIISVYENDRKQSELVISSIYSYYNKLNGLLEMYNEYTDEYPWDIDKMLRKALISFMEMMKRLLKEDCSLFVNPTDENERKEP